MPKTCHHCGAEWTDKRSPGFREECGQCSEPLHCCMNCRFYDESAHVWCREPQARANKPRDPAPSNTCDYFLFADTDDRSSAAGDEQKAKNGLAQLFGESPAAEKTQEKPDWTEFKKKDSGDIFKS